MHERTDWRQQLQLALENLNEICRIQKNALTELHVRVKNIEDTLEEICEDGECS